MFSFAVTRELGLEEGLWVYTVILFNFFTLRNH